MTIKSYLVFPHNGKKASLKKALEGLKWCEVKVAANEELLIMVAETDDEGDEEIFLNELDKLDGLEHYSLVSGFNEQ